MRWRRAWTTGTTEARRRRRTGVRSLGRDVVPGLAAGGAPASDPPVAVLQAGVQTEPLPPDDSSGPRAGASEAARMRRQYPSCSSAPPGGPLAEDRDRLTERLRRLNPDDWTDEAAVRAQAPAAALWNAISAELPSRRRGRRGGRGRTDGEPDRVSNGVRATRSAEAGRRCT
jgi:hypothetical protein